MQIINPITAESCSLYVGRPVCAVLHDGSRVFGYLKGVEGDQLVLTDQPSENVQTTSKKRKKKAATSAFSPYPPYGSFPDGRLLLDLSLIALLFAIPFVW